MVKKSYKKKAIYIYILEARGFAKSWRPFFENEPKMTQTSTEVVFLSSKSTKIAFLI